MKKISLILGSIALIGMSATASAAKPMEAGIYHCGNVVTNEYTAEAQCNLEWSYLIINSKSKGHQQHQSGDMENCTYYTDTVDGEGNPVEQSETLYRAFSDCEVGELLEGVATCDVEDPDTGVTIITPTSGDLCQFVEPEPGA